MADDALPRGSTCTQPSDRQAPDPRITVAMITRDRRESTLRTLDRLADLPERPPVIVVDNDSRDGTAAAVQAHRAGARVLSPGHNTGALGRNLAVRSATTRYVAFSDDDSWWTPGALRAAADLLDAYPRLGLVAARTLVGPGRTEDPLNAVLADSPLPKSPDLPGHPVLGFLGCACVVRRSAFLDAGGYHGLLFFGAEETLLAYDLAARGWGVCYVPTVTARHHPDPDARPGRSALLRRNALLTDWLRRPLPLALRRTLRLTARAAAGDRDAAIAARGVYARLPRALMHRRRLPPAVETAARRLDEYRTRTEREAG